MWRNKKISRYFSQKKAQCPDLCIAPTISLPGIYFLLNICYAEQIEMPHPLLIVSQSPALVAWLDACPTDYQEIAGSNPTGSAILFRGD